MEFPMSRAFVREDDVTGAADALPERPISQHPNYVTANGLRRIEATITELERAGDQARQAQDAAALARIERDLRYWLQRKTTARVVAVGPAPGQVRFGVHVVLRDESGGERSFRLVGEDEAEPAAGLISWAAPLSQQLLGRELGDVIDWQGQTLEIVELNGETPAN
jgi:transcription elongation GreA/GreB family factor